MKRFLVFVFLAGLLLVPAQARLGEKLDALKKRYGKPVPQERTNKSVATWLLEGEDGALIYTVTFDAKGRAVAEGLKPDRYAKFSDETIRGFIDMQLAPYRDSKTLRNVKVGEQYSFGGKKFVVAREETVFVDEANDFLVVLTAGGAPSVMAVTHVMIQ